MKNNPTPFSLRLTAAERAILEHKAGTMPLGAYIRMCLFDKPTPRIKQRRIAQDQKQLAQLMAFISATRIPGNLNQIAKAINSGTIIISEDIERDIKQACEGIEFIKAAITKALGFQDKNE